MVDTSQQDHRSTALNPSLLSKPFEVQTNWHVITGAPSCGKSTLINLLANRGFQTVPEVARSYLENEVAKGKTIDEIRSNRASLESSIKEMQMEIEGGLQDNDCIFLDRAIPDNLAWYRVSGLDPNELLRECFQHRYASVFILDQLPLKHDDIRHQDAALQSFLDEWHSRDYRALGYTVMRVAVMPPEERLAFVLKVLVEQGFLPQKDEKDRSKYKQND